MVETKQTKYQVMPDLTPLEYEALKADIAEHGVLVPVEVDENGDLLDGHHRVRAWNELTAEGHSLAAYPHIVRKGMTEEQKRNHARRLNVMRRQLSREQRDDVIVDMRKDGMSYREIANAVGVHHTTAINVVKNSGGEFSPPDEMPATVTGRDGKEYPATQTHRNGYKAQSDLYTTNGNGDNRIVQTAEIKPESSMHPTAAAYLKKYWDDSNLRFDPDTQIAYCKYCYTQHNRWLLSDDHANPMCWECLLCNHFSSDDLLEVENIKEPHTDEFASSDEYYTPPFIIEAARQVMGGIDLDPATCERAQVVVNASTYYTEEMDGLTLPWQGRIWLNPPFSTPKPFVFKAIEEYQAGNVEQAVILVNNGTETEWGQSLLQRFLVCFVGHGGEASSRISFWRTDPEQPEKGNRYAQMIFYIGSNKPQFAETFSRFGVIMEPAK